MPSLASWSPASRRFAFLSATALLAIVSCGGEGCHLALPGAPMIFVVDAARPIDGSAQLGGAGGMSSVEQECAATVVVTTPGREPSTPEMRFDFGHCIFELEPYTLTHVVEVTWQGRTERKTVRPPEGDCPVSRGTYCFFGDCDGLFEGHVE